MATGNEQAESCRALPQRGREARDRGRGKAPKFSNPSREVMCSLTQIPSVTGISQGPRFWGSSSSKKAEEAVAFSEV